MPRTLQCVNYYLFSCQKLIVLKVTFSQTNNTDFNNYYSYNSNYSRDIRDSLSISRLRLITDLNIIIKQHNIQTHVKLHIRLVIGAQNLQNALGRSHRHSTFFHYYFVAGRHASDDPSTVFNVRQVGGAALRTQNHIIILCRKFIR